MKRFIIIRGTNGWHDAPPDLEIADTFDDEEVAIDCTHEGDLVIDTLEDREGRLTTTYEKLPPRDETEPYDPHKPYPTTRRVIVFVWDDIEQEQQS